MTGAEPCSSLRSVPDADSVTTGERPSIASQPGVNPSANPKNTGLNPLPSGSIDTRTGVLRRTYGQFGEMPPRLYLRSLLSSTIVHCAGCVVAASLARPSLVEMPG